MIKTVKWGPLLPSAKCGPAVGADCDPSSDIPCCSGSVSAGWCGNSDNHCKCKNCLDFRREFCLLKMLFQELCANVSDLQYDHS